jgi:hypothetical protein
MSTFNKSKSPGKRGGKEFAETTNAAREERKKERTKLERLAELN